MLGMAFFKSLVKEHGKQFFEPIGKALQRHGIKNFNPLNPLHAWKLRSELAAYASWTLGQQFCAARSPARCRAWTRGWPSTCDFALEHVRPAAAAK